MTQMRLLNEVRATRADLSSLSEALEPLRGGIWLATDLSTCLHWVIVAAEIAPVIPPPDMKPCRALGLMTICSPDEVPVFLINEGDTIEWIDPDLSVAIRELGKASCEIRLEYLDDLDTRLISACAVERKRALVANFRTLAVDNERLLQVFDRQLPTGCASVDRRFAEIESTINARRSLFGPPAGTLDVMRQLANELDDIQGDHILRSYIWAAVLRERISSTRIALAA